MKVLSWNTLFAGIDTGSTKRREFQIEVINDLKPDIFLMQEAKGFELNGQKALFETEDELNMRGFLGRAIHTGQNTLIFINPSYKVHAFDYDNIHFHHVATFLNVLVPEFSLPVQFASVHLSPVGLEVRRCEAAYLMQLADPAKLSLITGDFNSLSPHDNEPENWKTLSPHYRSRYFEGFSKNADRTVLEKFEAAGFIDCGHQANKTNQHTVPTKSYLSAEFVPFRCDYAMASEKLAKKLKKFEVIRTDRTDFASDHYPICMEFDSI